MKKLIAALLAIGVIAAIVAPREETNAPTQAVEKTASSPAQAASKPTSRVMNIAYADYVKAANALLKSNKTGLTIPDHVYPTPNSSGGKNMQHDLTDGLTLAIDTDTADKIQTVRIVWQPEKNPNKSEQIGKAAAALLAAATPDDKSMTRDVVAQMNEAVRSNQAREFVRWSNAYKIASTNLPSVVLTAKPE